MSTFHMRYLQPWKIPSHKGMGRSIIESNIKDVAKVIRLEFEGPLLIYSG